ncbi:protein of unknown function [Amycolatopsis tolypomycina]|uniref:DUF4394 domain-containing protein n=1 Tax=Amycolatopsis tolypomycina TaxID=208445 RepID=A0A1H4TEP5_9PSEU|nr:DUF4394 domain-containing protein [Amycolatopsis tolypomycina]SEC54993.1 protein of unknown function [Amycolatopsis tolypomycina]
MKARLRRSIAVVAAVLSAAGAVSIAGAGSSAAQTAGLRAYGISADGTLMATFTTDRPQVLDWVRVVTGLSGDTALLGIDFRVQNGLLYGVGNNGGVYTISMPPATPDVVVKKVSQLSVPLWGTSFGVDFNPAADRLRLVSDQGQNLRHNLADGVTAEDAILTTPPALGPTRGVTAAAYTNNDLNPDTATTLVDINTATDQVVIQSPANNGTLAPTGALGVDAGPNAGFDIYSDLVGGKTVAVTGFATLAVGSQTSLYTVNLLTGAATVVGQFPLAIGDVAVALDTN